jgi:pimeloyl-ACP methyl ester carboxylesterase
VPLVASAYKQAVQEIRQLLVSSRSLGYDRIGLFGSSLGGQLAAIALTLNDAPCLAGLVAPPDSLASLFRESKLGFRYQRLLKRQGIPISTALQEVEKLSDIVTPSHHEPRIPRERILFAFARYDTIVPNHLNASLPAKWNCKNVYLYDQGHIGLVFLETEFRRLFAGTLTGAIRESVASRSGVAMG